MKCVICGEIIDYQYNKKGEVVWKEDIILNLSVHMEDVVVSVIVI